MLDLEARVRADLEGAANNIAQIESNLVELEKARVGFISQRDQYKGVADYCQHLLTLMAAPVLNDAEDQESGNVVEFRSPAGADEDAAAQAAAEGGNGDGGVEHFG